MRFISPISGHQFIALHDEWEVMGDNMTRIKKQGYTVRFKQGDVTDFEKDLGRKKLTFRGIPWNLDGSPFDPTNRIASFDTASIEDKELRARVEKAMLENPECGRSDCYILVEKPKLEAPWPDYGNLVPKGKRTIEMVADKIANTVANTGIDPDSVILYERENENRPEVIEALEGLSDPVDDEELVEA